MKRIIVNSYEELHLHFKDLIGNTKLIFRGQPNSEWKLLPKAGREQFSSKFRGNSWEKIAFESWQRYAMFFLPKEPTSIWDWLAIAQHHNFVTRLLDWTKNPLVATFFAVEQCSSNDGSLYYFEVETDDLVEEGDNPFTIKKFRVYFPKGFSTRIIQQRGIFTVNPKSQMPLEEIIDDRIHKIIISKECKEEILEVLEFYGVNRMSIFQDLDSLSEMLNNYLIKRFPAIPKEFIELPDNPFG